MSDPIPSLFHAGEVGSFVPVGANVSADGVTYRTWAPDHLEVNVVIKNDAKTDIAERVISLEAEGDGHFSATDRTGRAGDLYTYQVDGKTLADPASRFQPQGVFGPSQVVDSDTYSWATGDWKKPSFHSRVIYELHIGTFTREGTFIAAISRLDALTELGVNTIEIMPLADFAGDRNWGYDGVMLFAPARCYGTPDELRKLVDAAHARGLAVILDVVYNHLGPSGNVLSDYTQRYFHADEEKESIWGKGLNYSEEAVRRFFIQNACQWIDEYHIDGLRLDAVHAIKDESPRHLVPDIVAAVKARGGWVIAEDERNDVKTITPASQGGWGEDAVWSDDFHHTMRVALTGQQESHFKSYDGSISEWVKALTQGWVYDGQFFKHWGKPRGTPADHLSPEHFVLCISNHDQVGNRPLGDRLHDAVAADAYRAVSMLLCLVPYTPMLFMGQEWATSSPFPFFTDLPGDLGSTMREKRLKEFKHYGAHYSSDVLKKMPDPQDEKAFNSAKLNWDERTQSTHANVLNLYRECLRLRVRERIFQNPSRELWSVQQIGENLLGIRWRDPAGDWLLLGGIAVAETDVIPFNEPFIRTNDDLRWQLVVASNEPRFGTTNQAFRWRGEDGTLHVSTPGFVLLRETPAM